MSGALSRDCVRVRRRDKYWCTQRNTYSAPIAAASAESDGAVGASATRREMQKSEASVALHGLLHLHPASTYIS